MLFAIWLYRHFILSSIRNELKIRFARSKLGGLWMIINPLAQVLIYALILSNVLAAKMQGTNNKYAYTIYLMSGLLAWTLFSDIISRCLNLFIEQGNLLKKMNFPRITLPCIVVGSSLLNNVLLFSAMLGIFAILGHSFGLSMLWLILLCLIVTAMALGIGLSLGVMNIFLRDIGQVIPILLQIMFWFTPIVYPVNIIPEAYRKWFVLNPMYPITNAYQQVLLYGTHPDISKILYVAAIAICMLLLSLFLFRRSIAELVDEL